ncbi:MAG TPA: efflux transporter outer membrane subunit [Usitatibacter sp.]|nr:efflux transporter outer membrane subunit [Usitatibacter sp.]
MSARRPASECSRRGARLGAAVAALVLSGCTVGPDFVRPAPPADVHRYTAGRLALEDESAPDELAQRVRMGEGPGREWWRLFGSSELDALVERALEANRTLAAAEANLGEARELAAAEAGALSPQVAMTAGAGRQKYGVELLGTFPKPPPFTYFAVGPTVSYALDYVGGTKRAVEREDALARYREREAEAAYLAVTGNATVLALRIASLREQIATVEALLGQDRENVKLVRLAFEAGTVSRLDVVAAASQLATDATLLPPLRQDLAVARHALAVVAGVAPGNAALPVPELDRVRLPATLPVSVPSELVHRRPDILAAEEQLHAATAAVGVAEANLYPRITLTGSVAQESIDLAHLFDRESTAWGATGSLVAPLLDGGTLRAQKRAAVEAMRSKLASYEQTVLAAFDQVADALEALDHDAEELRAQASARETARTNADLTRKSYAEGNVGVLQVLDAQRTYRRAELGYVRAKGERYLDTARLFLALGGGGPPGGAPAR